MGKAGRPKTTDAMPRMEFHRRNHEGGASTLGEPDPPKTLTDAQRKVFTETVDALREVGLLTIADRDILKHYAVWSVAEDEAHAIGKPNDAMKAAKEKRWAMERLGLTPYDRKRMGVKTEAPKQESPQERWKRRRQERQSA